MEGGLGSSVSFSSVVLRSFCSSSWMVGSLDAGKIQMLLSRLHTDGLGLSTYRCEIQSDSTSLRRSTSLDVPRRCWYSRPSAFHGDLVEKNVRSPSRASSQLIPAAIACESGCFTLNQPCSSGSSWFLMYLNQISSSPPGIRSGLVKTPGRQMHEIVSYVPVYVRTNR